MTDKGEIKTVTLRNLCGGALVEMFDAELSKVLENIADVNTEATDKREIHLKVRIEPGDDRESASVVIRSESKLAALRGVGTTIFLAREDGQQIAVEFNPKQGTLEFDAFRASNDSE